MRRELFIKSEPNWLTRNKERISAVGGVIAISSGILAAISLAFTGWQFYRTREALEAQTLYSSMKDASAFATDDKILHMLASISKGEIINFEDVQILSMFNRIFGFYYANYVLYENAILSTDSWRPFHQETCALLRNNSVKIHIEHLRSSGYLPLSFANTFSSCNL